jgi:ABC-2 type transport system ATP-binding protein
VEPRDGAIDAVVVRQRLEQVPGVSRVLIRETRDQRHSFEVEGLQGRSVRPELARSVVEAGWNLTELRPLALSLEEIFLQLTSPEQGEATGGAK